MHRDCVHTYTCTLHWKHTATVLGRQLLAPFIHTLNNPVLNGPSSQHCHKHHIHTPSPDIMKTPHKEKLRRSPCLPSYPLIQYTWAARASECTGASSAKDSSMLDTAIMTHSWKYLTRKLQVRLYSAKLRLYSPTVAVPQRMNVLVFSPWWSSHHRSKPKKLCSRYCVPSLEHAHTAQAPKFLLPLPLWNEVCSLPMPEEWTHDLRIWATHFCISFLRIIPCHSRYQGEIPVTFARDSTYVITLISCHLTCT